jgi:hypothetical protein
MLSEDILEQLSCASANETHFIIDPIPLTRCGHSICKKCIPKNDIKEIVCCICGLKSIQDFHQFQVSGGTQKLLEICLEDIFKILEIETSLKLNEVKGNYSS